MISNLMKTEEIEENTSKKTFSRAITERTREVIQKSRLLVNFDEFCWIRKCTRCLHWVLSCSLENRRGMVEGLLRWFTGMPEPPLLNEEDQRRILRKKTNQNGSRMLQGALKCTDGSDKRSTHTRKWKIKAGKSKQPALEREWRRRKEKLGYKMKR